MKTAFAVYYKYADMTDPTDPDIKTNFFCLCKTKAEAEKRCNNYNSKTVSEEYFFVEVAILRLPLAGYWFDRIDAGIKRFEYREVKSYWDNRIGCLLYSNIPKMVIFVRGYSNRMLLADIESIQIVYGFNTDLHIRKNVYQIHFENVRNYRGEK